MKGYSDLEYDLKRAFFPFYFYNTNFTTSLLSEIKSLYIVQQRRMEFLYDLCFCRNQMCT